MSSFAHIIRTVAAKVGVSAFAALSAVVIARWMGTAAVGLYGLTRAVPAIGIMLTELGLSRSSPYLVNNRKVAPQRVLSTLVFAALSLGGIDVVLWSLGTPILRDHVLRGLSTPEVLLLGAVFPVAILHGNLMNFLRALRCYDAANAMRLFVDLASFVSIVAAVAFSAPVGITLVGSVLLGYGFALTIGWFRLRRLKLRAVPTFDRSLLRAAVHFGIRGQIGNALNFLNYRIDHLVLALFTTMEAVGMYVVATKAAELFKIVPGAVGFVLESSLADMTPSAAIQKVRRMMLPVFLGNLGVIAIGFVLGPLLLPVFFGSAGTGAVVAYQLLLVGMVMLGDNALMSSLNLGQGRPELNTYAVVVAFVVTIVLDIVLIPRYGIEGAAIASTCSYTACSLTLIFFLTRRSLYEREQPHIAEDVENA